jgi:hypothetical protein
MAAADFGKVLDRIESKNTELRTQQARLQKAYEKLDGALTRFQARVRIEPYEVDKKAGLRIGLRRFEQNLRISTMVTGLAGVVSEIPVIEAKPDLQVALMPHIADLLGKLADAIDAQVKETSSAAADAERLLAAIP